MENDDLTSGRRIPIFDGHNDALLRLHSRPASEAVAAFLQGEDKGQLDLAKARTGGFAGGLFAMFVPPPAAKAGGNGEARSADLTAPSAASGIELSSAQRTVFSMMSLLFRIEQQSENRVRVCRTLDDIEQCLAGDILAAVLHIEGAEAIDENFELLDVLYQAGLRSLGPVWSRPNIFGDGVPFRCPSSPDTGPGLTDLGKALIRACNRLKILIDLSHLNERGFWDVVEITDAPLVATHSNAHAVSPHSRNLTDRQLAAIRESGGLVGVNFATSFLRPDGRRTKDTPLDLVIQHLEHLLEQVGEDGVGLGSDFDGAQMPAELENAAALPNLLEAMRTRGFGEPVIEKVCFRNWLRVLGRTWGNNRVPPLQAC